MQNVICFCNSMTRGWVCITIIIQAIIIQARELSRP